MSEANQFDKDVIKLIYMFIKIYKSKKMENLLQQYLKSLNEKELQAYHIAKSHLGSSFSLEKSLGFIKWLENHVSSAK